jgi:mannose-6-phosphate isomerase-like protein (cupin superfamily)
MKIDVLQPTCNLDTVRDGRGGIFTWVPPEPILEFNMLHLYPGKVRGLHYHPHFVEYLLFVEGSGVLITKDDAEDPDCKEEFIHVSRGVCTRTPAGVMHAVHAISSLTFIAMLTKPWDTCDPPLVQVEPLPHTLERG